MSVAVKTKTNDSMTIGAVFKKNLCCPGTEYTFNAHNQTGDDTEFAAQLTMDKDGNHSCEAGFMRRLSESKTVRAKINEDGDLAASLKWKLDDSSTITFGTNYSIPESRFKNNQPMPFGVGLDLKF